MFSNMYITDEELQQELEENGDVAFEKLTPELQRELTARNLSWEIRAPTPQEQEETIEDARFHRITHNELTVDDFKDKYIRGRSFKDL